MARTRSDALDTTPRLGHDRRAVFSFSQLFSFSVLLEVDASGVHTDKTWSRTRPSQPDYSGPREKKNFAATFLGRLPSLIQREPAAAPPHVAEQWS